MASRRIIGWELIKVVCAALDIPPERVHKIIIEAQSDESVKIYITEVGDERLLSVDWNNVVDGSVIKKSDN